MNKRIDQYDTIQVAANLVIPVWDPSTLTTKNVVTSGIAILNLAYATQSTSGMVFLATSGEAITGTNNTKALTPFAFHQTIANNLVTDDSDKVLSAKQGKILQDGKQDAIVPVAGWGGGSGSELQGKIDVNTLTDPDAIVVAEHFNALVQSLITKNILSA